MHKIEYQPHPQPTDIQALTTGIAEYAQQQRGMQPTEPFGFFVKEAGVVLAGCNGFIYYGCMYIDQLWVAAELRGQGYGRQLMLKAEELAREKKCAMITLTTMDWEALGFYQKLGYVIEYKREGYVHNSLLYALRKNLN